MTPNDLMTQMGHGSPGSPRGRPGGPGDGSGSPRGRSGGPGNALVILGMVSSWLSLSLSLSLPLPLLLRSTHKLFVHIHWVQFSGESYTLLES
jgi:hypothetical protein